jgi:Holliday junction DNA helicase RuvA
MIARLKGRIEALDADVAVIDVGGVGYLVSASSRPLSHLSIGAVVARASAAGDKTARGRARGVGPKLAARVLAELKDKVAAFALPPAGAKAPGLAPLPVGDADPRRALAEDAVSALVNLGYGPSEAFAVVSAAIAAAGDPPPELSAVIARALKEIARNTNPGGMGTDRR